MAQGVYQQAERFLDPDELRRRELEEFQSRLRTAAPIIMELLLRMLIASWAPS